MRTGLVQDPAQGSVFMRDSYWDSLVSVVVYWESFFSS